MVETRGDCEKAVQAAGCREKAEPYKERWMTVLSQYVPYKQTNTKLHCDRLIIQNLQGYVLNLCIRPSS